MTMPHRFPRKSLASILFLGLLSSFISPLPIVAVEKAEAAQVISTSYSSKRGPFQQCPGFSGNCTVHWEGSGRQLPELLITGLQAGEIVRFDTSGTVDWGGNSQGTPNPSSCAFGPDDAHRSIPKLIAVGQFTNNANVVIAPNVPTPGNRGALHLSAFSNGVVVPAGATQLFASFPDTRYEDNSGWCSISNVQIFPVPVQHATCLDVSAPSTVAPG